MFGGISVTGGGSGGGAGTTLDTYANLPVTASPGERFIPSDGFNEFVWDGAAWRPLFQGKLGTSPGLAASWTNVDLGSPAATLTDDKGTLLFKVASANSLTQRRLAVARALPSTPFTLTVGVHFDGFPVNTTGAGLCFRDSASGRFVQFVMAYAGGAMGMFLQNWTNTTTYSSDIVTMTGQPLDAIHGDFYFHLNDPGGAGNLTWAISKNGDYNNALIVHNTTSRTAFTASPNQVGLVLVNENTDPRGRVAMRVFDWTVA